MLRKRIKSVIASLMVVGVVMSNGVTVDACRHNPDKDWTTGVCRDNAPIMYVNNVANANEVTIPVGRVDLLRKAIQFYDIEDGLLEGEEFHGGPIENAISKVGTTVVAVGAGKSDSYGNNVSAPLKVNVVKGNVNIPEPKKIVSDWANHWGKKEIQYSMCHAGFLPTLNFRPNDAITRAETVKVVTEMTRSWNFGDKVEKYVDVAPGDWFYTYVDNAVSTGLITQSTYFRPNDKITREEFAVIISNYKTDKQGDSNHDKFSKYSDFNQASSWAKNSIEYVIEQGYMGVGSDKFNPKANITRAEVATVMARLVQSEK